MQAVWGGGALGPGGSPLEFVSTNTLYQHAPTSDATSAWPSPRGATSSTSPFYPPPPLSHRSGMSTARSAAGSASNYGTPRENFGSSPATPRTPRGLGLFFGARALSLPSLPTWPVSCTRTLTGVSFLVFDTVAKLRSISAWYSAVRMRTRAVRPCDGRRVMISQAAAAAATRRAVRPRSPRRATERR